MQPILQTSVFLDFAKRDILKSSLYLSIYVCTANLFFKKRASWFLIIRVNSL